MVLYLPNFSLVFLIHVFLYAGVYCIAFLCSIHFRKMQKGDVGASNSDLQTDRADMTVSRTCQRGEVNDLHASRKPARMG